MITAVKLTGDLQLATSIFATARKIDDKKFQSFGNIVIDHVNTTDYSLGLNKNFAYGTTAQVSANLNETTTGIQIPGTGIASQSID